MKPISQLRGSLHGLPNEDGSYVVILKGECRAPRLVVRFTKSDGSRIWASIDRDHMDRIVA
jgi:hypothetical protein